MTVALGRTIAGFVGQWPRWSGYAAGGWALIGIAPALCWAAGRETGSPLRDVPGGRAAAGLIACCLLTGGIAAAASMVRRTPRRWVLVGLWTCCALAAAGTFSFVMNGLQLVFTGTVDDWPAFGVEVFCAVGAALFAGAALAFQRRTADTCPRCGLAHAGRDTGRIPAPPVPAPRAVRLIAYAGSMAFVPYIVMKTTWALGGTFAGVPADEVVAEFERNGASGLILTLERYGLDFTTLSALVGIVLLLGLTHRWGQVFPRRVPLLAGRRVPRWLPLTPAWLGALTLAPYGVIGAIFYLLPPVVGLGDLPDDGIMTGWSGWTVAACGIGAFGPYGIALGVAAWSYQHQTRPKCDTQA
ncbi:hypothetical protein ABZ801_20540 [Actinomadura sp. NPDC047616]|uniref:hypothetical protein n=1 Tax=Actinomadura sp. NPDC047616 TaxID=3155914 RepID=UPI0033D793D4